MALGRRFAWQVRLVDVSIIHLVKSETNAWVLGASQKQWQAWGIRRRVAKIFFSWQALCKRHLEYSCSEVREQISEDGCILAFQIIRIAEMMFRDRCSASYDLGSLLRGQ